MIAASALFAIMAQLVQGVGAGAWSVLARGTVPLLLLLVLSPRAILRAARSRERPLVLRTTLAAITILLAFYALERLPTSLVAASLKAAPVWLFVLAVVSGRIRLGRSSLFLIPVVLGIVVLGWPNEQHAGIPMAAALLAGLVAGVSYSMLAQVRRAIATEVVAHFSIGLTVVGAVSILLTGKAIPSGSWPTLFAIGALAYAMQWLVAFAFRHGRGEIISFVGYFGVLFAAALDIFVADVIPGTGQVVGAALLLSGTLGLLALNPRQIMVLAKVKAGGSLQELRSFSGALGEAIATAEESTSIQMGIRVTDAVITDAWLRRAYDESSLGSHAHGVLIAFNPEARSLAAVGGTGIPRFRFERDFRHALNRASNAHQAPVAVVAAMTQLVVALSPEYPPDASVEDLPNDVIFG